MFIFNREHETVILSYIFFLIYQASTEVLEDLRFASLFALSEPSIIKRTSSCQNYFQKFVNILKPKLKFQHSEKIIGSLDHSKSTAKR